MGMDAVMALAHRIGAGLAGFNPETLHFKIFSTFDGSKEIGNIALLAHRLADTAGLHKIAVIGGQPLRGHCTVFATPFAKGPGGRIHRTDRHPVMSTHPVRPYTGATWSDTWPPWACTI